MNERILPSGANDEPTEPDAKVLNSHKWLQTAQTYLKRRAGDYAEAGNHDAVSSLLGLQQLTLDFLAEGVKSGDPSVVDFVSGLEEAASDGRPYDSPNYIVMHGTQLDQLALAVERAQAFYDDAPMPSQ